MADFEVIPIGVGDTFSERHVTASLLLRCGGFNLAIDCPDRYRGALRDAGALAGSELSLADIDHVLITHVHGDHMNGLEGVAFFKHFVEGKRVRLVTSAEVRATIWDQRLCASMGALWNGAVHRQVTFEDYFEHLLLAWEG